MSRRPNISAALRRRRALRVALGSRKFRWRPLDRRGRLPVGFSEFCSSYAAVVAAAHSWLNAFRPNADSWWFFVEELAFDENGKHSVVVDYHEMLVYRQTLWTGFRAPFVCEDRKAVCYG